MPEWKTPGDLKYSKTDEWIRVVGDTATIGLTDYAQDALNDVVYVELPGIGDSFGQSEAFGTVESVKAASELRLPVGGSVTEINHALEAKPELMNSDPFGAGWIIKIKVSDPSQLSALMDAKAYAEYCQNR